MIVCLFFFFICCRCPTTGLSSLHPPLIPPFAPVITFPLFSWGSPSPLEAFVTVHAHMPRTQTTHRALSHLCPSASGCLTYSFNFIQTCIFCIHRKKTNKQQNTDSFPSTPVRIPPTPMNCLAVFLLFCSCPHTYTRAHVDGLSPRWRDCTEVTPRLSLWQLAFRGDPLTTALSARSTEKGAGGGVGGRWGGVGGG